MKNGGRIGGNSLYTRYDVRFYPRQPADPDLAWFISGAPREVGAMRALTTSGRVWKNVKVRGKKVSVISFWVSQQEITECTLESIVNAHALAGRILVEFIDSKAPKDYVPQSSRALRSPNTREVEPNALVGLFPPFEVAATPTLVIPDLHNQVEHADFWLSSERYSNAVFLGDYFDGFNDSAEEARRTAVWLRRRLHNRKFTFLLGNHDVQYRFPENEALLCPGYSRQKADAIRSVLREDDWQRMKLAHFTNGWLISHAGFHPTWMPRASVHSILTRCGKAVSLAARGELDPILAYGDLPGGVQRYGGPLWQSWENFLPIVGINQLVGHTSRRTVGLSNVPGSENACIDVGNGSVVALLWKGSIRIVARPNRDSYA